MPDCQRSLRGARRRARRFSVSSPRRTPSAATKLGASHRLIAPAHSLTMPSLEGIKERVEVSLDWAAALPAARALIRNGFAVRDHFEDARSPVDVIDRILSSIVESCSRSSSKDDFDIEIQVSDRLDEMRAPKGCLFFVWANSGDPQYIPLRPIFEQLEGNPWQVRLMASLYRWLYLTSWRVFHAFGFSEAKSLYEWRKESYTDARESGEDVDLEGEVEYADPANVVSYIKSSERLRLKAGEIGAAMSSILNKDLRDAFDRARHMFERSRRIKLPEMSDDCRAILEEAAYYMEGDPFPAVGISHWRDDAIVAWFDDFCQDQFNSGVTCRAPIIRCFRPNDTKTLLGIVRALPRMVETVFALSEWVRWAGEMENACQYSDRG